MGGKPILALNIACFPSCLDMNILGEILRGGADKVKEAGAIIVGGHTIDDNEPKYGLSVMGMVHPDKVLPNANSKPGDLLVLTKPIGTGVVNTAIKGEIADDQSIEDAVKSMTTLNKYAAETALKYKINACTDITGFGLIGHGFEMAKGSGVSIHLYSKNIKFIKGSEEYAKMGIIPAGTYRNKSHVKDNVEILISEEYIIDLLYDPQTSGGLMYSLPKEDALNLNRELNEKGIESFIAGYVTEAMDKFIYVE